MEKLIALTASQIKDLIKQQWRSREIKTRVVCVVGHRGVGKTEIMKQAAQELDEEAKKKDPKDSVECRIVNLQFTEATDICLPYVEGGKVKFAASDLILPEGGKGILFFDEANRCNKDIRQALITLLQERRVNKFPVGEGWIIVLAMNPLEADGIAYEVQEFDSALEDRIAKIEFKGDIKEFLDFMSKKYTDSHPVVKWVMNQPDVVDFKGKTRTSPRGLEYLITRIGADNGEIAPDNKVNFSTVAVEIGIDAATVFFNFLNSPEYIKADDILKNCNAEIKGKLKTLEETGKTDMIHSLNKGLSVNLSRMKSPIKKQVLDNLIKYLETVSFENQSTFWLELDKCLKQEKGRDSEKYLDEISQHAVKGSELVEKFFTENDWNNIDINSNEK